MTAVTGLGVFLGILVFALMVAFSAGRRIPLGVVFGCAGVAGGCVTYIVVAAGMLVLGEPS